MQEKNKLPRRQGIRLPQYCYNKPGQYFVTICIKDKVCLFGNIFNGEMILNDAGKMIQQAWENLIEHFFHITLDQYQIMPNHIHGIIVIQKPAVGEPLVGSRCNTEEKAPNVLDIIGAFKSISTNLYIAGVRQYNWPRFQGKLWQRGFYDHIIRNNNELANIREYIANNPRHWGVDCENIYYGE